MILIDVVTIRPSHSLPTLYSLVMNEHVCSTSPTQSITRSLDRAFTHSHSHSLTFTHIHSRALTQPCPCTHALIHSRTHAPPFHHSTHTLPVYTHHSISKRTSSDAARTEVVLDHLMHCVPPGDTSQCVRGQTPDFPDGHYPNHTAGAVLKAAPGGKLYKLIVGPAAQATWYGHFSPNATSGKVRWMLSLLMW
jgi:hypothetical protein